MNVAAVKHTARSWISDNLPIWPGLHAAHLVGGITAMPDDTPFPSTKDVDIHLIFDDDSPALHSPEPFANILEILYEGIIIEAGIKPCSEYSSPAAVLANPEIAYHLTRDSILYDPYGFLAGLGHEVRAGYGRREWVHARIDHERRGHAGAMAFRPVVAATHGASAEWNILGYTNTFLAAALQAATLSPPKMGGRTLVHLRYQLAQAGRLDLHERALTMLGVENATPAQVEDVLTQGGEAFELALAVKRTPHHFQHKLHAHLRPYFEECCRGMMADGFTREALPWAGAFCLGATDIILTDAPEHKKPRFAARQDALIRAFGMDTAPVRDARYDEAARLATEVFALADAVAAEHPAIQD
ncbi:MAG: hypothetical protein H0U10_06335 [Chloroflexia bacterium]|nr:hypothetical protein [Chloroflexia bacterium]